jgi:membrane protein DedA with SNARE-associated domain
VLGTGLWAATFTLVGYAFHDSFSAAAGNLTHAAFALALLAAVILAFRARQRAHKGN